MNTVSFIDMLEYQYFLEDITHKGFRKDYTRSQGNSTTYINKAIPTMRIVMNIGTLTADLYDNDNLVIDDKPSANVVSRLTTTG